MDKIPTKKLALTNSDLTRLVDGLNVISQGRQITVDGKNVPRGFVFNADKGRTRYALARIGILIKPLLETFKAANDDNFSAHNPVAEEDANGKEQLSVPVSEQLAFGKATAELFARETELIEYPLISYESLNVGDEKGQNPITPNAIAALAPVLVWTQAEYDALAKGDDKKPASDTAPEAD